MPFKTVANFYICMINVSVVRKKLYWDETDKSTSEGEGINRAQHTAV